MPVSWLLFVTHKDTLCSPNDRMDPIEKCIRYQSYKKE